MSSENKPAAIFPQSYPLWAVRASNEAPTAEVGLVVGWECFDDIDGPLRYPIVASLADSGGFGFSGVACDWRSEVSTNEFCRYVELVELFATFDEAKNRVRTLTEEVDRRYGDTGSENSVEGVT